MRRKNRINPKDVQSLIEQNNILFPDRLRSLESSWKNSELGQSAPRPKREKSKSCSKCKAVFDPDYQGSNGIARNPETGPYQFSERFLFIKKDLCLDCLELIESKS